MHYALYIMHDTHALIVQVQEDKNVLNSNRRSLELKVQLPDRSICTVCVPRDCTSQQAYHQLVDKMQISEETAMAFSLFQLLDNNFSKYLTRVLQVCDYSGA